MHTFHGHDVPGSLSQPPPHHLSLSLFWPSLSLTYWPLACHLLHLNRIQLGRSVTAPLPQPTTAAPWVSFWCMMSPTRTASTLCRIGKQRASSGGLFVWLTQLCILDRVTQIKTYSWDNAQVILVGNKCDMEDQRVISFERGRQLADQLGVEFFETSAKENVNVKVSPKYIQYLCIGIYILSPCRLSSSAWWTSSVTRCPRAWTQTRR